MLPGLTFWFWRSCEILTLIPTVGMLSWFVHGYTVSNALTPTQILVLFIVSVLALFWAAATLLAYRGMTRWNAHFCAFVDLCFVGALIAGVFYLRDIKNYSCDHFNTSVGPYGIFLWLGVFGYPGRYPWANDLNKNCAMLKASWAFGIMNIIFFFITFLALLWVAREYPQGMGARTTTTRRRYSSGGRGSRSPGGRRSRSSYHSTRRTYY